MTRTIQPKMFAYLDGKAMNDAEATDAIKRRDPRGLFARIAQLCDGIREVGGNNEGLMVELIQKTLGGADKEPWCFPASTEVLTRDGWMRFDEITGNEEVAQVRAEGEISYTQPIEVIRKPYQGAGYTIQSNGIRLTCDKGHRFWGMFNNHPTPRFGTLDEVTTLLSVPGAYANGDGYEIEERDLILLAAFLSDGFLKPTRQGAPRIRIQVSKPRKIEALRLLNPVGDYTASKVYGKTKTPLTTISFKVPDVFDGIFQGYKRMKWEFVSKLSREQCRVLLDHYLIFDGSSISHDAKILFSSRKELADQLLTIAVMAGYHPSMGVQKSPLSGRDSYSIRWSASKKTRTIRSKHISKVEISEDLFCVSMPQGRIIVRGEEIGTPMVVGNCMSFVQTCLAYVEQKLGVISPIHASEHCLTVWNETPEKQRVKTVPLPGAIVIWQHQGSSAGHTGITTSPVKANVFRACEGNTESGMVSGKVERDGGGVYSTIRSVKASGSMRIVGFLKPFAA